MRAIAPALIPLVRRADSPAKDYLEALVIERNAAGDQLAHIRDTKEEWAEADGGAAAVDADFTRFDDGSLRLKGTITTLISHSPGAITYFTDLNRTTPWKVLQIEWSESAPADLTLDRLQLYLNPRRDTGQKREVSTWRVELMAPVDIRGDPVRADFYFDLVPIAEPIDATVTGDAAGFVTFDYGFRAERPQPIRVPRTLPSNPVELLEVPVEYRRATTFVFVYALTADGSAAGNVGQGYDSGTAEVTSGGHKIRSREIEDNPFRFLEGNLFRHYRDLGSAGGTPYCIIESGTYTEEIITFSSGNLFDLGGAPTGDVELVGLVQTPSGTSVTLEVRNDADSAWVAFTNGQFEEADLGFSSPQSKKMRATLTPNAAGNLTPTLRKLGRQAIARIDFSRVATIEGYEQAFDPETHRVEIPRPRLVAVKDGPRDFKSKIEKLLAENFINDIRFRWFVGAPSLSRDKWTHMEDFLVLDSRLRHPVIELQLVGLCALLKDLAPPFSPGTNHAPDGTQTIGSWTDLAGGTTNIHLGIDELVADETDGIRSGLNPSNQEVIFTLPTPTDIAGRRLFVDCDYAKDASGGQTLELKIRLYQTTALVAELVKADIGADRVQSTMELTEAQIAQLTDLTNVRVAFVANATGGAGDRRAHVYWARFRSGGRREVVTYTNQTLKAVYDDLLTNRLSIPANLRGPGVENTTTTVSKQITGLRKRSPGQKDVVAKTEIEAVAFLADVAIGSSEGRIKAFDLSSGQTVRAIFRSRRIKIGETSPGHEQRIPEYFVPYRWDPTAEEFTDEVRAFHTDSILKIGTLGLGPPQWLEEEIAKWIDTDALAEAVGRRTVERLGTGEMLWSFASVDRYPELEMGDIVAVETDLFVSRDPNVDQEIKGRRWAVGPLQRVGAGRFFTIHVRGYADILSDDQLASRRGFAKPTIQWLDVSVDLTGRVFANAGTTHSLSIKVAASVSAMPTDATVRAATAQTLNATGQLAQFDTGVIALPSETIFVKAFSYEVTGGGGVESAAQQSTIPFPASAMFDNGLKTTNFTVDWRNGSRQKVQLGASGLSVAFINGQSGARYTILWQQDTTGSRTLPTHDTNVAWPNETPPTLSTGAGVLDLLEYPYDSGPPTRYYGIVVSQNVMLPTPLVQSVTTTSVGIASTTHNISMPATVNAGDLLLIGIATSGTSVKTTPGGWTRLNSNSERTVVYAKAAAGTEGGTTVDVVTVGSETAAAHTYRVTSWFGTVATGVAIQISGGSYTSGGGGDPAFPDPPILTPGWTDRSLWLALLGMDRSSGATLTYPTSYTSGSETVGGVESVGSARRTRYASSENPGTFSSDPGAGTTNWDVYTLAVRPPV